MDSGVSGIQADWYYVGHYGQLGPLTLEQMGELIRDGVIERDTYVWRTGMSDWVTCMAVPTLAAIFAENAPYTAPPPPPTPGSRGFSIPPVNTQAPPTSFMSGPEMLARHTYYDLSQLPVSDRSRVAAGVLNILIPGVGRMYLGYWAHGVLQLVLSPCLAGWLWSVIDGVVMLSGGLRLDGFGRRFPD